MSHKEMYCLRSYFVCQLFLYNMASKTSQTNLGEQGKLLLAELGKHFLEVESKGYI